MRSKNIWVRVLEYVHITLKFMIHPYLIIVYILTELELNLPLVKKRLTRISDDRQNTEENPLDNRFMQIQAEEEELERQQACLQAWTSLHNDLEELQQLFIDFNQVVHVSFI